MTRLSSLFLVCFLICGLTVSALAKSVKITQGYVDIIGSSTDRSSMGNSNTVRWEMDIKGDDFAVDTVLFPDQGVLKFSSLFVGIYDTGQNISPPDFSLPFHSQVQAGIAHYRAFDYTKIQLNPQNSFYFIPQASQAVITNTTPGNATASVPFEATGNLILKCTPAEFAPDCNAPIRRVRIYGKGTMIYNFVRWSPSDGQWAWLNVRSVKFIFEE